MNSTRRALATMLLTGGLVLAACGDDDSNESPGTQPPTTEAMTDTTDMMTDTTEMMTDTTEAMTDTTEMMTDTTEAP